MIDKLRVMSVPEHFMYPFILAQQHNIYNKYNLDIEFIYEPLGTGEMLKQLKNNNTDIIVALTEGIVYDIAKCIDSHTNDSNSIVTLLGTYVQSSLQWSISVGINSKYNSIEDLHDCVWSISRYGSGSHLMVCVLAIQRGWNIDNLKFEVCGNFKALRDSVNQYNNHAFMWENFMQKPYYDNNEIKRVGEIYTPWSSFMYAATQATATKKQDSIKRFIAAINDACNIFRTQTNIHIDIAKHHNHNINDTKQWYDNVNITSVTDISRNNIQTILNTLQEAKQLPMSSVYNIDDFVDRNIVNLTRDIKTMKLYSKPEMLIVLYNNLRYAGLSHGSLSYKQLLQYDQNSYYGTDKLDSCVELLNLNNNSYIIQIGSSVGGVARYLAGKYNIHILAVELQHNLHQAAVELTERCEQHVQNNIDYVSGNILNVLNHIQHNYYDGIISMLTVLHLTQQQRITLFKQSYNVLKHNGYFYAEDFVELNTLTQQEKQSLQYDVYCNYISIKQQYINDLQQCGFSVTTYDMTQSWLQWCKQRSQLWLSQYDRNIHIHGKDVVNSLQSFYDAIVKLFEGGNVGGIRIVAKKI